MPFKVFRFKHLKDHTAPRYTDPFSAAVKKQVLASYGKNDKICPVYLLPLLISIIFIFTIAQIVMIHRTIEAYKLRDQAYKDCYYPKENGIKKNETIKLVGNETLLTTHSSNSTKKLADDGKTLPSHNYVHRHNRIFNISSDDDSL